MAFKPGRARFLLLELIAIFATQSYLTSGEVIMKMRKITLMVLPMLFATGAALAQSPQSTITESTDPAKVAEVERRAEALRSGQASSTAPTMQQRMRGDAADGMRGEHGHMHGGKGHHHGGRAHHRGMHGDHPKAAPGSGGAAR
jgi:hypothetical protein